MKTLRVPPVQKYIERQLVDFASFMSRSMLTRFINELKATKKKDVDRMPSRLAKDANIGKLFKAKSKLAQAKLLKQFSNERVEKLIKTLFLKHNKVSKKLFYDELGSKVGVDPLSFLEKDGLTYDINTYIEQTAEWFKKYRDDTIYEYTANTLRIIAQGGTLDDVVDEVVGLGSKATKRSVAMAQDQIKTFNSTISRMRALKVGVSRSIWSTSKDDRVRKSHQWRDGREFETGVGLYSSLDGKTLRPSEEYSCRCTEIFILED